MKASSCKPQASGSRWIHRVEGCVGVTLWAWGSLRVELWVCWRSVGDHAHPGQRVRVLPLWGWGTFWQRLPAGTREAVWIGPRRWWRRWLTIPAGAVHGFAIERRPLVILNATGDGRSAGDNFVRGETK